MKRYFTLANIGNSPRHKQQAPEVSCYKFDTFLIVSCVNYCVLLSNWKVCLGYFSQTLCSNQFLSSFIFIFFSGRGKGKLVRFVAWNKFCFPKKYEFILCSCFSNGTSFLYYSMQLLNNIENRKYRVISFEDVRLWYIDICM